MEVIAALIDFILHVDVHLQHFVLTYGVWVYALLFLIVFVETGVVVMPFLPGDSLLFVVGALCGLGLMNLPLSCALLFVAAVLGDQVNYTIGRALGPRVFRWENSRFFNRRAFDQAHAFYERWGGVTIVAARFMPFIRTFAPFVAGVSQMRRRQFLLFNVLGAFIWVVGLCLLGYAFGQVPLVKQHMEKVIWALIVIPAVLVLVGSWKARRAQSAVEGTAGLQGAGKSSQNEV